MSTEELKSELRLWSDVIGGVGVTAVLINKENNRG